MGFDDWSNNKKKKKSSSFEEWSNANRGISKEQEEEDEKKRQAYLSRNNDDIAPVGGNKDSWFKSGGFSDGVDGVGDFFGDLGETVGGTVGDLGLGILKGAGRLVEGVVDLGTYGVAGVADAFGADDFADKAKKVAQYSAVDEWTKPATDFLDQYSVLGNKADMVSEGLGQVGAIILTGGAAAAAGLGGAGVAALTTGLTGLSGMGSGMNEAYSKNATDGEAFLYGLGTGAIEAGTELLFGGLGKGVKALGLSRGIGGLDDIFAKKLSSAVTRAITNEAVQKIAGNTIEAAIKAGGEGAEEVLSGLGSAVMKKLTYEDDESIGKLIEDENLLEQFVVGAITSSIAQGADFVKANKSGRDFVTGYTNNEQAVIDKEVERRVSEREKAGKKLTTREISAIEEQVQSDMEHGQLDIETIEEVLGGESYTAYKDTVKSEDSLKAEYEQLANIKKSDLTTKQEKRLAELEAMNLDDTSRRDGLRKKLDETVFPQLKDSKLAETYKEGERKGQAFEADLSKYTGKQRAAVERAVKSGVLNNTYRSHELVDVLSKIEAAKGISFDYTNNAKLKESGFAVDGKTVNGYANKKTGSVTLNVQSSKAWQSVVGHEITHVLEGTEAYGALQNALYAYANSKGELDSRRTSLSSLYQNMDADIDAELTADLVGDYLFTDKDFINHLTGNRTLFQKVYDEIKYLWNVATGKEKSEIEKVKAEFDRAWKEYSAKDVKKADGKVQHSITEIVDENNKSYGMGVNLDSTLLENLTPDERVEMVKERVKELGGEVITAYDNNGNAVDVKIEEWGKKFKNKNGKNVLVNKDLATKYIGNETKQEAVVLVDELILTAKYGESKPPAYPHGWLDNNGENDWEYWTTYIRDKNNTIWQATLNIATTADGEKILYDVSPIKKAGRSVKSDTLPAGDSIAPSEENVNTQFSLSDSDGNQLSKEQQEYFAESKVRDENGNLKVMYHGTPSGDFTVFRDGTYFTEHKWYADLYQNPGASSINSRKTVTNPRTYKVYLDIKKPFDISDPEARDIYINEYIKGGNATGINPYLSDAEYAKISSIDWTEGEDLRDFLIDNEYDYDGLVLDEGAVGGYGDDVKYRGKSYVIFSPEQVKEVENKAPTDDPDIRFSLSESVEETKDLVAVHNLHSSELLETLKLSGLPSPSVAIIKAKDGHEKYGDVSLILPKEAIDPQANKANRIYGSDAWTPTRSNAQVEYEVDYNTQRQFEDEVERLADSVANGIFSKSSVLGMAGIEGTTDKNLSEIAKKISDYDAVQAAYIAENGGNVEIVYREKEFDSSGNKTLKSYIDKVGEQEVARLAAKMLTGERLSAEEIETAKDAIVEDWTAKKEYVLKRKPELRESRIAAFREKLTDLRVEDFVSHAWEFYEDSGATTDEIDYSETGRNLHDVANRADVEAWVTEKLQGLLSEPAIYNGKDPYTPSGKQRSFKETHWDYTAENIVRAMNNADARGANVWNVSGEAIIATATQEYKNIDEVRADKDRLYKADDDYYEQIKDSISAELRAVTSDIIRTTEHFSDNQYDEEQNIGRVLMEAAQGTKTAAGIKRVFSKNGYRLGDAQAESVLTLFKRASTVPTGYFEAKPQRVVGFEEVGVYVIPNNADVKLKQELLNRGYSIAEYDPNVDGDRQRVVNQFEEYKFSLSNVGEEYTPAGNYSTPLRDLALEKDIAPVATNTPTAQTNTPTAQVNTPTAKANTPTAQNGELFPEGYAPVTEEEADALSKARYEAITDADAPPEMPAPYYGEELEPVDPFESRDMKEVGSQKVKAYMYENPEVKPFFQQEAEVMLGDLYRTTQGERIVDAQVLYDTNGEAGVWGVKRHTAPDIAELKDRWGYTYDEIEAGIKAIIEDNGKENNACSKRIEFMLNDRLMNGYQDFVDGFEIPANQEYRNLINEKGITEYNEEARKHFFDDIESYIPPVDEDIAPTAETEPEVPIPDEIAPMPSENNTLENRHERIDKQLEADKALLAEDFARRKAEAQAAVADKGAYFSNKAFALYNEVKSMRKGVRVSEELGYLLDHLDLSAESKADSYNKLRTALLNIKNRPGSTVNQYSAIEAVAREMLNASYESAVYDLDDMDIQYQQEVEKLEADAQNRRDASKKEEKALTRSALHGNIIKDVKATFDSSGYDFDDVLSEAKNLSTFATVDNTPQRVMEKALGYKEGQVLADLTVNRVAQNESAGIKWLNSFTDRKNGLLAQISKQYRIKPGSKESAAAQMYAEGFYVDDNNDIVAYGDTELAQDFPDVGTQYRIKGLAHDPRIRQIYDETLAAINDSRVRNAYPEIQKLDNYFLHFRAMDDTFSRLGLPFNPNDIRAKDLPTDLNGVTADLKPGQPYFASAMHRTGKRTSFDLLGGLERYLTSAKNQIYHIDDIQTLRALRNYIADTYGQANGLEGIDALSEEEAQEKIEMVYGSHLSTFAKFLNEEANVLAGKTALIDRGLEGVIGRRGMTFLDTLNKQVGSNMVGFNISSSLTNFLPVAQTFAKTNKFDFTKAFAQTVSNKISSVFGKGDGFAENSPVIIRRKGADRFYRTPWQKAGDAGYVLMSAVDDISTELIARTKFNEFTRQGMDEQAAHIETDKWVSRLMGDRSLGQQPQLYNSKTLGLFTKFQLEVRNQLDSQFYDTIQEAKVSTEDIENALARNAKTAAKVASTFAQLAVVQHLYGKAFESVAGYNPAFDIISTLATMFGFDDEEESEDTALDNIEQGFLALLEDLPYTSTFTGGRIPLESALPIEQVIKGEDQYGNEKSRLETLGEAAPYYVLPGGYGQIKKTTAGLGMFSNEHPVSGSYTDSGNLRFPVEDTPANRVQAAVFGQYASENAREYFDNEYAPLKEKQIQEYIDVDIPIKDYWKYRQGLAKQDKLEDKLDYISGLDLPVSKKNILANNVTDRKEPIDLTNYDDFGSLEEFDFATKQPEKYAFAKSVGGYSSYKEYSGALNDIKADKDASGKSINGSRKEKVLQYINNLDADYDTKIILFKSEYPSDDSYNAEIIEYLNGRDDLTYEERVSVLTELGFRVTADGQIYAD